MKFRKIFCICFAVFVTGINCDERIHFKNLMMQYFLVCGPDYFCGNVSAITGFHVPRIPTYSQLSICPMCKCDFSCISRGDCCPDLYFTFPTLTCVNRSLVDASDDVTIERSKQRKRLMVNTCPVGTDDALSKKCSSTDIKFKFLNQPVTDITQNIAYTNGFCAECNLASNRTGWDIDIRCDEIADFNFLSSVDDIIDYAFEKKCIIQAIDEYLPNADEFNAEICIDMDQKSNLTKCNVTGAWSNYDKDIQAACESDFFGHFRHFRNIFCYMCNPSPVKSLTQFLSCNETGVWSPYDNALHRLCEDMPHSPYTHPFKNIFCYLCNQNLNGNGSFVDVNGEIKEIQVIDNEGKQKYEYDVDIESFNVLYLQKVVNDKLQHEPDLGDTLRTKDPFHLSKGNGMSINLTSFFMYYVSQFGNVSLCPSRKSFIPIHYTKQCLCEPHCVFSQSHTVANCCTDAKLDIPVTCRNEFDLSPVPDPRTEFRGYLVVNGCFQETSHMVFDKECKKRNMSDIFSILPLTTRRDIYNISEVLVSYDNVYCSVCNLFSSNYISELKLLNPAIQKFKTKIHEHLNLFASKSLEPWDLQIICSQFLPIQFNILLGDLIEISNRYGCSIRYETKTEKSDLCYHNPQTPQFDCSDIANWTFIDEDVKWACQNTTTFNIHTSIEMSPGYDTQWDPNRYFNYRSPRRYFTNRFCSVCKPDVALSDDYLIDTCNATGFAEPYSTFLENACEDLPQTYYYYPFKNLHCTSCNNMMMRSFASDGHDTPIVPFIPIPGINWFPILRNMFSLDNPAEIKSYQNHVNCSNDEVYDSIKMHCIKTNCFPGKFRRNERCMPLLRTTKKLHYTMSFSLQIFNSLNPRRTDRLMQDFARDFDSDLSDKLGSQDSVMKSLHQIGSKQCHEMVQMNNSLLVNVSVTLFIEYAVIRNEVERILLEATNASRQGNLFYSTQPLATLKTLELQNNDLPIILPLSMQNCIMSQGFFKHSWKSLSSYKKIEVSNILFCVYVILHEDEIIYDDVTEKFYLTRNNRSLEYGKYQLLENNSLAVCKEELEEKDFFGKTMHDIYISSESIYLWRVQVACTVLSCICLFIAIVIYCIFPHLRSIPGIINMITFFTLLVTLIFSQTGYLMVESSHGCKILGVCLHVSWLCVFTTMNMCNFHMNRVFLSGVLGAYPENIYHMFAAYSAFAFGTPILLASVNIMYSEMFFSSLGYGGPKCFITKNGLLIATFLVPVALIIIANILLFISTSVSICKTPKANNSKGERSDFGVVIRIASITGLTWIFQITDMFFPQSAFTYVATIMSSLQGLFVFLAFMANSRVYHLVQKRLSCRVWKFRNMSSYSSYSMQTKFSEIQS